MRLRRVDASNLHDHHHLTAEDECYFLHEYTSGAGFSAGEANNLISNLKKPVDRAGKPEYVYKTNAISRCSTLLKAAINPAWLKTGVLVPVPPSKAKEDPLYDDRVVQICRGIGPSTQIDVRELVLQSRTIRAAHTSTDRPSVHELETVYGINADCCWPEPKAIAVLDDVLTAGTHFRAMQTTLSNQFPSVKIIGIFLARRVFANPTTTEASSPF